MSLYWVARLPIKRPKGRTSVFAETGVPVHDANADVEKAIRDTIEATLRIVLEPIFDDLPRDYCRDVSERKACSKARVRISI